MLIQLGKVTRETRACAQVSSAFDHPVNPTYLWFQKVVAGKTYICNSQPAGYVSSTLCKNNVNGKTIFEDCTK